MSEKSEFRVLGLAHKFALAWEKAYGTPADLNKAAEDPTIMRQMVSIARGFMEAEFIEPTINCDAPPLMPAGWALAPYVEQFAGRVTGKLILNPCLLATHFLDNRTYCGIPDAPLAMRHPTLQVLTAHVLDGLLEYPVFIPETWKAACTYFPGTLYIDAFGSRCMRGIEWDWESGSWKSQNAEFPPSRVVSVAVLQR